MFSSFSPNIGPIIVVFLNESQVQKKVRQPMRTFGFGLIVILDRNIYDLNKILISYNNSLGQWICFSYSVFLFSSGLPRLIDTFYLIRVGIDHFYVWSR